MSGLARVRRDRVRSCRRADKEHEMTEQKRCAVRQTWTLAGLILVLAGTSLASHEARDDQKPAKTLYVWTGDQARIAPDFLAVIDFDEGSPGYGTVIRTVPV